MPSSQTDVVATAEGWLRAGHSVALATVISTWGSAPRRTGSHMAVREDGAFAGSVSGGCVEGAVIDSAIAAMSDGKTRRLEFGVQDEKAWSVGLACGGRVEIYVEPLASRQLRDAIFSLNAARRENRAVVRAMDLSAGDCRLIDPESDTSPFGRAATAAALGDRSRMAEVEGQNWFLCVFNPPVDLVIVGAVHIGHALAQIAAMAGHTVRVIDPRASFATAERFPGVALIHAFPDDALSETPLSRRSALVVLSHDPKIDDPALAAALLSPAFYVGALGSKRTQAARLGRLKARGFLPDQLARIHGPVGLAIGAATPEEIAISIVAEITAVLRKPA